MDDITVYYKTGATLTTIVKTYEDFIMATTKQPLLPYPVPAGAEFIIDNNSEKSSFKEVGSLPPHWEITVGLLPVEPDVGHEICNFLTIKKIAKNRYDKVGWFEFHFYIFDVARP